MNEINIIIMIEINKNIKTKTKKEVMIKKFILQRKLH